MTFEEFMKNYKAGDEFWGRSGFDFTSAFDNAFNSGFSGAYYTRSNIKSDPIYKQCLQDAMEYFKDIPLRDEDVRRTISPEHKERIFVFLKNRLEYYGANGFVMPA